MGVQVANREGARMALDLGIDYLVCQGTEAGGHVQSGTPLYELLPNVLDEARNTPVLAAGGIGTGQRIRTALLAGASAAVLGTRFVATQESRAHPDYKSAILKAHVLKVIACATVEDRCTWQIIISGDKDVVARFTQHHRTRRRIKVECIVPVTSTKGYGCIELGEAYDASHR